MSMSPTDQLAKAAKSILANPDHETLRTLISKMPNARRTGFDNYNVATRVTARSKASTFIVANDTSRHSDPCISSEEWERVSGLQDTYVQGREMIVIDGYIGNDKEFRVGTRLIIEASNANVAAMQQTLYFPVEEDQAKDFKPELTVLYTPNLPVEGYPNDRLIAVNLELGLTRVFNSDYFGESKKGGLRMWNKIVYDRGGLALHAGCKIIPVAGGQKVGLIVGLSGTGKTTTTFTRQNGSSPVQDDFTALMPDGSVYATENGCFAKTFGLDAEFEPTIYAAVTQRDAYLENVYQDDDGTADFFNTSYTRNGRAVFGMDKVKGAGDAAQIKKADFLLILNRNESIIPAVARLGPEQAAAYFMLGETKGTSAGGAEEAGKFLRVPGTNPFFPLLHAQQGNRMRELLETAPMEVYLMNTGRVGGADGDVRSKKVKIPHSSAIVKAIAEGSIEWQKDPDFGYELAVSIPDFPKEDQDLLAPRAFYQAQGRIAEYDRLVGQLKEDRKEYMARWPGLDPALIAALN